MKDTCDTKCKFWKKYGEHCPNYIESAWRSADSNEFKRVKDCAPKRTFLMLQSIENRLLAIEKQINGFKNVIDTKVKTIHFRLGQDQSKPGETIRLPKGSGEADMGDVGGSGQGLLQSGGHGRGEPD